MKKITIFKNWLEVNKQFFRELAANKKIDNKVKNIDVQGLYQVVHQQSAPCFFLSTGRCGTKLITKLMNLAPIIQAYHQPDPELIYFSKIAYESEHNQKIKIAIDCARYQYTRNCFLQDKKYIETNNRITFFAYYLAELYPKAKFIHVVRDPYSFIKSGLSRKWYTGHNLHDEGRIKSKESSRWQQYSRAEKIAWLWQETNKFILDFQTKMGEGRVISIRAEDIFSSVLENKKLFSFLDLEAPSSQKIKKIISKPVNAGKKSDQQISVKLLGEDWLRIKKIAQQFGYKLKD
jgi:hypothetical protein